MGIFYDESAEESTRPQDAAFPRMCWHLFIVWAAYIAGLVFLCRQERLVSLLNDIRLWGGF